VPAPIVSDPIIGQIIGERYRVLAPLGRGGMGAVYRVEHTMMKKELALKLLHPELGRLDEIARRFEREAEAAAKLDHPNIIQVTDFGRTRDGLLFLVMELLHGVALTEEIRTAVSAGAPFDVTRTLHIARQILLALEHAHARGIVHRDLKPDNIMLISYDDGRARERDIVKLVDFGIAKMRTAAEEERGEVLTQAGVVFGTPEYLSPEQAMGEEADGRADLYSTGVVLYEMLTGHRPFEASSKVAVVSMHITQNPMPVSQVAPRANIPLWLERVVARALAKKRDERFASASAFLQAIDSPAPALSRASSPTLERTVKIPGWVAEIYDRAAGVWPFLVQRANQWGVARPRTFVATAAGVLLALLVLLIAMAHRGTAPQPPPAAVAESLARAEGLLARGELEPARAVLQQLASTHPDTARVHYLFGNLDYAQGERERALSNYHDAIRLDDGYRYDPVLRDNVRALLERRSEAAQAVALLADDVGAPALADLVACAKNCRDERTRRRAAEAALKLGGPALLADEAKPVADDGKQSALERLHGGRTCRERKAAALEIIATGDHRYLDALVTARERRGGFLGMNRINGCMRRELDAAIRKWEAEK
jgi:tRNA A-37 threonylcarbamoyl transferase component Bud32/tetratricopeptide (TPR) repeat protein